MDRAWQGTDLRRSLDIQAKNEASGLTKPDPIKPGSLDPTIDAAHGCIAKFIAGGLDNRAPSPSECPMKGPIVPLTASILQLKTVANGTSFEVV